MSETDWKMVRLFWTLANETQRDSLLAHSDLDMIDTKKGWHELTNGQRIAIIKWFQDSV